MKRTSPISSSPGARLLKLGSLAGGIAAGMAAEGLRQMASGSLPRPRELLLTPKNAARLAERLSDLRGAAMKVGQLLSMEAGDLLPPELSAVLARLREDAHRMPLGQVAAVLNRAWGKQWPERFSRFDFQPLAAASIGQVHEATTRDAARLAVKIQYPGIRDSIDSDVDNVARLLSMARVLPEQCDIATLLSEAKQQLHEEADYLREAEHLEAYRRRLGDQARFRLPEVVHPWTTAEVLCMTYVPGAPLDALANAPRATRNQVAGQLLQLALQELFDWGLVQTDPNFANYRYDANSDTIGLLDFGAVRCYPKRQTDILRSLLTAAVLRDTDCLFKAAAQAGYTDHDDPPEYRQGVAELLMTATEPARHIGAYDFSDTDLARRMSDRVMAMRFGSNQWRLPSTDLLFLHRKLGGLFMLFCRLGARVPVHEAVQPYLVDLSGASRSPVCESQTSTA